MSKETETQKLARMAMESTRTWEDDRIELFGDKGRMIAYIPSDLFKIGTVVLVRYGAVRAVTYLRACFGDSTKTSVENHVLRLINDNHDMAQKLVRIENILTYYKSENDAQPKQLIVRRISSPDSPKPRTYTVMRDINGVITGFRYNR